MCGRTVFDTVSCYSSRPCCCLQDASQDEIDAEEQRLLLLALQSSMGIFSTLP